MGRTLHYTIKKDTGKDFTKKELVAMYNVSKFYNSKELLKEINSSYGKKLKDLWTCENFWLGIGAYYPHWENPTIARMRQENADVWGFINEKLEQKEKSGLHFIDAVEELRKEGYIEYHSDKKNEFHGFTKTQGNEFNSLLVFKALVQISKDIPSATITLHDEGEFLLCNLKIKKGKVLPDMNDLMDDMRHYALNMLFSKGFKGNILKKLNHSEFKTQCFQQDSKIGNGYGDMTKSIDDKLRNLQEIEKALMKAMRNEPDNHYYFYNLNNRQVKDWFSPELFVRPVDIEKFLDYEMSAGTLMDGFDGQGFGLSDKDSEAESYRQIAQMFSLLGKAGFKKENVKVLGVD